MTLLRNQESGEGPNSGSSQKGKGHISLQAKDTGRWFSQQVIYSKRQIQPVRAVYPLLPSSAKESFSNFLFTSRAVASKTNDYKREVGTHMKNTTLGLTVLMRTQPAGR